MTNRWLKGVAIAALTAASTMAAQAADLPTRKEAPPPVFVPPPFTWTGFYVGLNAGGVIGSGSRTTSLFVPAAASWIATYYPDRPRIKPERLYRRRPGWVQLADRRFRDRRRNRLRWDNPEQILQLYQPRLCGHHAIPGRHLVGEREGELGLARHDARALRLRRHARQSPHALRNGRRRLRRRKLELPRL